MLDAEWHFAIVLHGDTERGVNERFDGDAVGGGGTKDVGGGAAKGAVEKVERQGELGGWELGQ